jgi:hypothetical protein
MAADLPGDLRLPAKPALGRHIARIPPFVLPAVAVQKYLTAISRREVWMAAFETAAFLVGPYRNLTTLSAAVLSLHPEVQVLNHAGERMMSQPEIDFAGDPRPEVLEAFLQVALAESAGGQQGQHGGSILLSHAFASPIVREAYLARYGQVAVKADARCLIWKESYRLQSRWMGREQQLEDLFSQCSKVRLLAPFRRPLDVAVSSMKTKHSEMLTRKREPSFAETLDAVLDAFAWVLRQRDRWPDRVFFYTQWEVDEALFARMARFLGLSEDERWIEDALRCFAVRPPMTATDEQRDLFRERTAAKLSGWPELAELALA